MKYEAVFGNQELFKDCSENAILVISDLTPTAPTVEFFSDDKLNFETVDVDSRRIKVAMRRIIADPKRWTVADQQAGRLPPAGSKYLVGMHNIELECLYNDSKGNAWGFDAQGEVYGFAINYCSPIETQAEKAQRLEDEHLNMVAKHHPEFDIPTARAMYRMYLSGELEVPKEVDQS